MIYCLCSIVDSDCQCVRSLANQWAGAHSNDNDKVHYLFSPINKIFNLELGTKPQFGLDEVRYTPPAPLHAGVVISYLFDYLLFV